MLLGNVTLIDVKEKCTWDDIPTFSFILSLCFDIMHDLLEGVGPYELSLIMCDLIFVKIYFTLETLNNRIFYFDYGPTETSNAVPQIIKEHLTAQKLKFSSAEMLCFIRYFGLMVGDVVPDDADSWLLYLELRSIVDIVTAPYVNRRSLNYLATLIFEHHEMYLLAFPNNVLWPKHHFMLHYPQIMLSIGPLWFVCCLCWEAKHKNLKQASRATNSRKNLPYTLAVKHQLQICARCLFRKLSFIF